jgi:NDP-4-keto-2,6-dideoxyhexose 3-C-methyltransferase
MVDAGVYRVIDACRICRSRDLRPVIELGEQALTGRFPRPGEPDPPKAPLDVVRCVNCGLVQLRHSVTIGMMFGETYGYRSGMNQTMRAHLAGIAADLSRRADLKRGDAVLDIGCNDGTLLISYPVAGLARFGIDPIAPMFRDGYPAELSVRAAFFNAATFREMSGRSVARGITSIAMFYDLENPAAFVADVAAVLADDGIWVLEQGYLPSMLEQNSFDSICHEHLEYYALAQIDRLVRERGLRIFDVGLNRINGGSFQIWVCHQGASYTANQIAIDQLRENENRLDLNTDAPYTAFRKRVDRIGAQLNEFIAAEAKRGRNIYVYGASTKGNVLLQYLGLGTDLVRACADKNPKKWKCRTPGTGIPIVSEEEARANADYFLVLPWAFRDEFLAREAEFRARGGKFIFPLPEIEIL